MHLSIEQLAARAAGEPYRISPSAISYIEQGRNLPTLETLMFYERTLFVEPAEVLEYLRSAPVISSDLAGLSFEGLYEKAAEAIRGGDHLDALRYLDGARQRLIDDPSRDAKKRRRLQVSLALIRASALKRAGAVLRARSSMEHAVEISDGFPDLQSQAYAALAELDSTLGYPRLAGDAARRAVDLSSACPAISRALALDAEGKVLDERRSFDEARKRYREVYELLGEQDPQQCIAAGNIGYCWLRLHKTREASAWIREALDKARAHRFPRAESFWLIGMARVALEEGRLEQGERFAEAALRVARGHDDWLLIFKGEWLLHKLALASRRDGPDAARMGRLRKLLPSVHQYRTDDDVKEFLRTLRGGH